MALSNYNTANWTYDAQGTKLRSTFFSMSPYVYYNEDYCGSFVFRDNELERVHFDEGYITLEGNNTQMLHYYLKDHQGNVRMVVENGPNEQTNEYYPYGGLTYNSDLTNTVQPYKYNGKELDRIHGLDMYDYGARQYDPNIGRFTQVDPLAEKYYHLSPYAYCGNNPVNAVDPDGKRVIFVNGHHNILFGSYGPTTGGEGYWATNFVINAQKFFNDFSYYDSQNFVDGSSFIGFDKSGADRFNIGRNYAHDNMEKLTFNLGENEPINIVTHSEGSAFGAGIADYLISQGVNVNMVVHLSADEGDEFSTPEKPFTIQFGYEGDWVTGNHFIKGADIQVIDKSIKSIWDRIQYAHGSTNNPKIFDRIWDALYSSNCFNYNQYTLFSR